MCGILLVQSKHTIDIRQHLAALKVLESRGPDYTRYEYRNNIFIAQAVLHITGTDDFYNEPRADFLAYNGEIYNKRWFGYTDDNDVELVYSTVKDSLKKFKYFEGPWAWAYTDFNHISYATDPQGEHYLYRYQDNDILIVCSEVAPILTYINAVKVDVPYQNKNWTMQTETPWKGVERLEPGRLYVSRSSAYSIDNIWSWIKPEKYSSFDEAAEHFDQIWNQTILEMKPVCNSSISFSGGLDSSLILNQLPESELVATNMIGKDPIVDRISDFLTEQQQLRLKTVSVDFEQYAQEYNDLMARTQMPVQSWSFVGKWIVAKNCQTRVLFTGLGADELFGGYDVYQHIEYNTNQSYSPYSKHGDPALWQQCLEAYEGDPRQATLLMDYWYQIIGCDAPGTDRIAGSWGIEVRNPFMTRRIMQFALNLPWEYKVGLFSKPIVRQRFLQHWPQNLLLPKKGFTGHANDSLPWLGVEIESTGDRHLDWQKIAYQTFYR